MSVYLSSHNKLADMSMQEGFADPLGATVCDNGVNFSVFSDNAERIEVCVFDKSGKHELHRYDLYGPRHGIFCGRLLNAKAGLVYGLRAQGAYLPQHGHRFNPSKLLLDPYAREIVGKFEWHGEHHGYTLGHTDGPNSFDLRDNADVMLKARVAENNAEYKFSPPRHAARNIVLYASALPVAFRDPEDSDALGNGMRKQTFEKYFTQTALSEAHLDSNSARTGSTRSNQQIDASRNRVSTVVSNVVGYKHEIPLMTSDEQGCVREVCQCSARWDVAAQAQDAAQHWRLMRRAFGANVWSET